MFKEHTQEDTNAAYELALDMKWVDATKFLRDIGVACGLRDAFDRVENLGHLNPDSVLAKSLAARPK